MGNKPDLRVNIGGLSLRNPVMTASGTFGYGEEYTPFVDLNRLGAIIVKGLSLQPSKGNKPPRIAETPCGISTPVIVNIYGKTKDEYSRLAERIEEIDGISGIEVNISCPNVKKGGIAFGVNPKSAYKVTKAVREKTSKTLIVKLSPNVTDISEIAVSAVDAGADSLSLINTITGMSIDINTRRSRIANITGGLSGPAIRPIALRMVWETARKVKVPVIGIGGITSYEDAIEFFIAGATAVQIGTANFVNPKATVEIIEGIEKYLADRNISSLSEVIGTLDTKN
jgi:dihydroorotate dehydrogenase (NAD+) catalytic subunit